MDAQSLVKNLHPLEIRVLRNIDLQSRINAEELVKTLSFNIGQANQAISWLSAKELLEETSRKTVELFELTELGKEYAENGTPTHRIISLLKDEGPKTMPEICQALGLENKDVGSAFGQYSKLGVFSMGEAKKVELKDEKAAHDLPLVAEVLRKAISKASNGTAAILDKSDLSEEELKTIKGMAKKRGASTSAFKSIDRELVEYRFSKSVSQVRESLEKAGITGEEIGELSSEIIKKGSWKDKSFRSYSMDIPPGRITIGRRNPYCEYLDLVKDKLTTLGFEEFDGPLVETEFWNSDALFMPQFHSARDIHDVYYVKNPHAAKEIEQPYLDQISAAHENGWETGSRGWGYNFDKDFTKRLILRSQGTVMSAKTLPKAKNPSKYFGVLRCFRYDQVDATHLSDFYQTEGIVVGEDVNLRTLLGLLKMFAEELAGATEVKYVPGYFPFTEPSVEVHIKHPVLGWFELGGSGIFRPEVTKPLGIDVPVLAWGLGIDRMALMHLGLDDLRELFSHNIDNIRLRRRS